MAWWVPHGRWGRGRASQCHLFTVMGRVAEDQGGLRGGKTSVSSGLHHLFRTRGGGGSPWPWLVPGLALGFLDQLLFMVSVRAATVPEVEMGSAGQAPLAWCHRHCLESSGSLQPHLGTVDVPWGDSHTGPRPLNGRRADLPCVPAPLPAPEGGHRLKDHGASLSSPPLEGNGPWGDAGDKVWGGRGKGGLCVGQGSWGHMKCQ